MRRTTFVGLALLLGAGAVSCGDDAETTTTAAATGDEGTHPFCDRWLAAIRTEDDGAVQDLLAEVPAELEDVAAVLIDMGPAGGETPTPAQAAASAELMTWTQLNCDRRPEGASERVVAPPAGTEVAGLRFCGTDAVPALWGTVDDDSGDMVLYGDPLAGDLYAGPMLGLFWNSDAEGEHRGDGDGQAVTVRGVDGVAAPITPFQQLVLPELGTVVAWSEGGRSYGLYGRGWPATRVDELVAVADRVEITDEGATVPAEHLPDGYEEVVAGQQRMATFIPPPDALYGVRYLTEDGRGIVQVTGVQQSEDEFEAVRFLALDLERETVSGLPGVTGAAWHELSPLVAWREPDGLVVRVTGIGVGLDTVREVAAAARELDPDEWAEVVSTDDTCGAPRAGS